MEEIYQGVVLLFISLLSLITLIRFMKKSIHKSLFSTLFKDSYNFGLLIVFLLSLIYGLNFIIMSFI
jgi:hypothetical protein